MAPISLTVLLEVPVGTSLPRVLLQAAMFPMWAFFFSCYKEAIIGGRRLFQILLTESLALNVLFYYPLI